MNQELKHQGRLFAMQFLYQNEREHITHFNLPAYASFVQHFSVPSTSAALMQPLIEFVYEYSPEIDELIEGASLNWKMSRMCSIDRALLRLGVAELALGRTPRKVVINEAIDLAKEYGTEHSGRFINGILDKVSVQVADWFAKLTTSKVSYGFASSGATSSAGAAASS